MEREEMYVSHLERISSTAPLMNHSGSCGEDVGFAITPIHFRSEEKGVSPKRVNVYQPVSIAVKGA